MPATREPIMPETPGDPPASSHAEAGTVGEDIQIHRRDAADHDHEANKEAGQ